jgi:hypothetical protein
MSTSEFFALFMKNERMKAIFDRFGYEVITLEDKSKEDPVTYFHHVNDLSHLKLFKQFLIDLAFTFKSTKNEPIDLISQFVAESEVNEQAFFERFDWIIDQIKIRHEFDLDRAGIYAKNDDYDIEYLEGIERLKRLCEWVSLKSKDRSEEFLRDDKDNTSPPLFVWNGDQLKLVELILALSATGWITINAPYSGGTDITRKLQEYFLIRQKKTNKLLAIKDGTFKTYFEDLDASEINSLDMEGLYALATKKIDGQKIKENSPFRIKPIQLT